MKRILLYMFVLLPWVGTMEMMAIEVSLSSEEQKLYDMIMQYRAENNLPPIPLSASLTYVAQTHVHDLQSHPPTGACNLHSWSNSGKWSPVCYTSNPSTEAMKAMWNKPRELTNYPGAGYEISYWFSAGATASSSLRGWKSSPDHNAVIINRGMWSDNTWQAIGIGIYGDYAVVWFGEEKDPESRVITSSSTPFSSQPVKEPTQKPVKQPTPKPVKQTTQPAQQQESRQQSQEEMDRRMKEMEQRLENLQEEQKKTTNTTQSDARETKIKQQNREIEKLKAEKEQLQKDLKKSQERASKENSAYKVKNSPMKENHSSSWLNRFYDYSGFSSLSYISAGYMYSCMDGSHLVNASLLDFRASLFSASLLNVEMAVSPFNKRFAYKPNIRIYIPIAKCLSLVPYGGAEIDASYIGKYFDKNYAYDVDNDFYINAVGGIALNLTAARHVPIEIKVEYRHPVLERTAGALNTKGVYVGAQIYFGSVFEKRR